MRRHYLAIFMLYIIITLIVIAQPPIALLEQFIGNDIGDNYEMARNIWWFKYAIQTGEPLFYQTYLGYPDGINGIIFISVPLQYFPMWALAFIMPIHVAYNLTIIVWMALNGLAMCFLMRDLLDDKQWIAPFIAGVVYLAFPLFQGHLAEGHAGLMIAWATPLYVWALLRYTETDDNLWRWLGACILFFYLSTTGHILQSIYVLMPVTGTVLLVKLWQRDWQSVKRIISMGLLASVVLLAVLAPAILDATGDTTYSAVGGYSRFSADLLAIVSPSFLHPFFDSVLSYPRQVNGTNLGEGLAYIGVIAASLSIIGLITQQKSRWWLLLAGIAWILSLGPALKIFDQPILINGQTIPLPFAILQNLPGFSLARTPARFNYTLVLALAVMVGYGAAWLWQQRQGRWRYAIALLLIIGILWEYQSFWGQPLRSAEIPEALTALSEDDSVRAVFNIPYQHALAAKDALYLQTGHQQPLIAGQITRTTPVNPLKLAILQATLDPDLLSQSGADIVILHRARAEEIGLLETLETHANQQLGTAIYQDEKIAVYRVPSAEGNTALSYDYESQNITFGDEINLLNSAVLEWENQHYVWLQWAFDSGRPDSDVRFVHFVDDNGEIILQNDSPLGEIAAGELINELLVFDTSDLSEPITIRTGWYDFNSLTNYPTADSQGAVTIANITP